MGIPICLIMATPAVPNRHAKQTRFLAALARGTRPDEAAVLAGVPLATFYTWRRKHTRFREAWDKAVAYAQTPPFPPAAQLAALDLSGPRTHWVWLPGGLLEGEPPFRLDDRVVTVLRSFSGDPDLLIFSVVMEEGRPWREIGRGTSLEPLPPGFAGPPAKIPAELSERLPPGCAIVNSSPLPTAADRRSNTAGARPTMARRAARRRSP